MISLNHSKVDSYILSKREDFSQGTSMVNTKVCFGPQQFDNKAMEEQRQLMDTVNKDIKTPTYSSKYPTPEKMNEIISEQSLFKSKELVDRDKFSLNQKLLEPPILSKERLIQRKIVFRNDVATDMRNKNSSFCLRRKNNDTIDKGQKDQIIDRFRKNLKYLKSLAKPRNFSIKCFQLVSDQSSDPFWLDQGGNFVALSNLRRKIGCLRRSDQIRIVIDFITSINSLSVLLLSSINIIYSTSIFRDNVEVALIMILLSLGKTLFNFFCSNLIQGTEITDFSLISKSYLSGPLYIYLVSDFMLILATSTQLNPLFQILVFLQLIDLIKTSSNNESYFSMKYPKSKVILVLKIVLAFILLSHLLNLICYVVNRLIFDLEHKNHITQKKKQYSIQIQQNFLLSLTSYINVYREMNYRFYEQDSSFIYFKIVLIVVYVAFFVFSAQYLITQCSDIENIQLNSKLEDLNNYLLLKRTNEALQDELRLDLLKQYKDEKLKNLMNDQFMLRNFDYKTQEAIKNSNRCQIFDNLDVFQMNFTSKTISLISNFVQEKLYNDNDLIFEDNRQAHAAIYILSQGRVALFKKPLFDSTPDMFQDIAYVEEGNYFGEYCFFTDFPENYGARSSGNSQILILSREKFKEIIQFNQKDRETFMMINDDLRQKGNVANWKIKCRICEDDGHLTGGCFNIHYVPDLLKVRIRHSFEHEKQVRKEYFRDSIQFKSLQRQYIVQLEVEKLRRNYRIVGSIPSFDENDQQSQPDYDNEDQAGISSEIKLITSEQMGTPSIRSQTQKSNPKNMSPTFNDYNYESHTSERIMEEYAKQSSSIREDVYNENQEARDSKTLKSLTIFHSEGNQNIGQGSGSKKGNPYILNRGDDIPDFYSDSQLSDKKDPDESRDSIKRNTPRSSSKSSSSQHYVKSLRKSSEDGRIQSQPTIERDEDNQDSKFERSKSYDTKSKEDDTNSRKKVSLNQLSSINHSSTLKNDTIFSDINSFTGGVPIHIPVSSNYNSQFKIGLDQKLQSSNSLKTISISLEELDSLQEYHVYFPHNNFSIVSKILLPRVTTYQFSKYGIQYPYFEYIK